MVHEIPPRAGRPGFALDGAGARRSPPAVAAASASHAAVAAAHARRGRIPVPLRRALAFPRPPRPPLSDFARRPPGERQLPAGRIGVRPVRRQFQLARPRVVPGQLPAGQRPVTLRRLLRRGAEGRVPDRLRPRALPRPGRRRADAPAHRRFPRRPGRPPDLRRQRQAAPRPALPRPHPVLRVFPRRQRARHGRLAPDRLDRAGGEAAAAAPLACAAVGDEQEGDSSMTSQTQQTRLERILGVALAEEAVRKWPQSGELIRGKARIAEVEAHFVGLRLGIGRRLACGDSLVVEWTADYGDGRLYRNVTIAEFANGKAIRVTDYWGEPFAPPAWREALAEPLDMPPTGAWPAADALEGD